MSLYLDHEEEKAKNEKEEYLELLRQIWHLTKNRKLIFNQTQGISMYLELMSKIEGAVLRGEKK